MSQIIRYKIMITDLKIHNFDGLRRMNVFDQKQFRHTFALTILFITLLHSMVNILVV